jgi:glucose 1-dehydrogenase
MSELDGTPVSLGQKVAVVTGGTRGLGLAIAMALSKAGASVMVASRSQASVDEAVAQITSAGGKAAGLAVDVSSQADLEVLADRTIETFGRLDLWINNAGTAGPYGPTVDLDPTAFEQVVRTNILGVYYGSRVAMRHFLGQGSGKLINLVGRGYNGPVVWQNAYGSSKAWVRNFTLALAEETRASGVGVFAFNPGMVLTDLLTHVDVIAGSEGSLKSFGKVVRMWARPPEVPAKKVVWIASSATDGKTGKLYSIFSARDILWGLIVDTFRTWFKLPQVEPDIQFHMIEPYNQRK